MKKTPIKKKTERFCACGCGRIVRVFNSVRDKYFNLNCQKNQTKKPTICSFSKKELQSKINTIVKLIDKGHPCIVLNTYKDIEAGHYFSIGSNETLRFNLINIWVQSKESNQFRAGETDQMRNSLMKMFGQDFLDSLEALKSTPPIKPKAFEIEEYIKRCNTIIKWLKSQKNTFTIQERLSLRIKFNKEIGIYPF